MKKIFTIFTFFFSLNVNAGFVADEAAWILLFKAGNETYFHDPYQMERFPNGDVEILIERLKDKETRFTQNPERIRFACEKKDSLESFILQNDGSWKKKASYPISKNSVQDNWATISCDRVFDKQKVQYIGTTLLDEPSLHVNVYYWDQGKALRSAIENSRVATIYHWRWLDNKVFKYYAVVKCESKELGVVYKSDEIPTEWIPLNPRNTIRGFIANQICTGG